MRPFSKNPSPKRFYMINIFEKGLIVSSEDIDEKNKQWTQLKRLSLKELKMKFPLKEDD